MDEHDKRAREVLESVRRRERETVSVKWGGGVDHKAEHERHVAAFASALRSTAAAAVAAERERVAVWLRTTPRAGGELVPLDHGRTLARLASDLATPVCHSCRSPSGQAGGWSKNGVPVLLCERCDVGWKLDAGIATTDAAPAASPARPGRVSEEGWAANAERQLTRNGGWHVPGYSEDEHAVRFETVTDAHARSCRETQVRIAARLRARADEELADGRFHTYDALRAEADALEGT